MRPSLLVIAVVALAACSGDGDGPSTTLSAPSVTSAPVSTAATTTALAPTTVAITTTTAAATLAAPVFAFTEAASVTPWRTQDDTVMGGVSRSTVEWGGDGLVFSGALSLENNGGFTSMIGPPLRGSPFASRPGFGYDVTGDGRAYLVQVGTGGRGGWVATVATTAGARTSAVVPWDAFAPVDRFLEPLPETAPLDPGRITTVRLYLVDKQPGPFRLVVHALG